MNETNNPTSGLARTIFGLKDPVIFLGSLYFVCFLVILPLYLKQTGGIVDGLLVALIGVLSIALVHLLFN